MFRCICNSVIFILNSIKAGNQSGSLWWAEQWEQDQGKFNSPPYYGGNLEQSRKANLTSVLAETPAATWEEWDDLGFMDKHKLDFWQFVLLCHTDKRKKKLWHETDNKGTEDLNEEREKWKSEARRKTQKWKKDQEKGKRGEEVKRIHFSLSASCKAMIHLKRKIKN